jgi:autotransporter adhesin
VDKRIDQIGAAGAAWAGLAQNTSGSGANSVGLGVGSQGSQQAIAVGYRRALGEHASFSFGGAASSGKASVSAGVGFNW